MQKKELSQDNRVKLLSNSRNPIHTSCVEIFILIGQSVSEKNAWRTLTVSQYFRLVVKMGSKPRKTLVTVK